MPFPDPMGVQVGTVSVFTTNGGPTPPEHFAERIVEKLIFISETAPQPIRDQALAYRAAALEVVLNGIRAAIGSDRAYRPRGE